MAAYLIWKTLKTVHCFYRLCFQNFKTARVGSCSLEPGTRTDTVYCWPGAGDISMCLLLSLGHRLVQFVPSILGGRLCMPPKKWQFVSHLSSLSSKLQVALNPKGRSVALAAVVVLVTQGHPWFSLEHYESEIFYCTTWHCSLWERERSIR